LINERVSVKRTISAKRNSEQQNKLYGDPNFMLPVRLMIQELEIYYGERNTEAQPIATKIFRRLLSKLLICHNKVVI